MLLIAALPRFIKAEPRNELQSTLSQSRKEYNRQKIWLSSLRLPNYSRNARLSSLPSAV
jgi:hypothetical protein